MDRTIESAPNAATFATSPGDAEGFEADATHWTEWVGRRMKHIREVCDSVDVFLAPSRYLMKRFRDEFGIPQEKLAYLDYGFHRDRLEGRTRAEGEPFTFGYIGTHIPAKGVHHLIEAFGRVKGGARLRIWGRDRGVETASLRERARRLPGLAGDRIEWMGEYENARIVPEVFNRCDAIVVPSIWAENSPLVIHEALQAGVPVVTANYGGMAEYVRHEENGLLFAHRDPRLPGTADAAVGGRPGAGDETWPQGVSAIPRWPCAWNAGARAGCGGAVRQPPERADSGMTNDARAQIAKRPGPWRITFDTNPDDCNLHCIMCEDHSPYSSTQRDRIDAGRPKRRMAIDLIERVLAESRGTPLREIIPSTMGEPLLFPDFDRILDLCATYGVKLNLTTNGTFPKRGARAWAGTHRAGGV